MIMTALQDAFEELIATSLPTLEVIVLDQPQNNSYHQTSNQIRPSKSQNLTSSGSIDDFLLDYRHEDTSILQFMSCLEDSELVSIRSDASRRPSSDHISAQSVLQCRRTQQSSSLSTDPPAPSTAVASPKATAKLNARTDAPCKGLRIKMTAESKAERRREKNREYQRRFREKKMRLQVQQMFVARDAQRIRGFLLH